MIPLSVSKTKRPSADLQKHCSSKVCFSPENEAHYQAQYQKPVTINEVESDHLLVNIISNKFKLG